MKGWIWLARVALPFALMVSAKEACAQSGTYNWNTTSLSASWFTTSAPSVWSPSGKYPGVAAAANGGTANDVAVFGTSTTMVSISATTSATLQVGAISFTANGTTPLLIGNSSTSTVLTVTLNGAYSGNAASLSTDTLVSNTGTRTLTLAKLVGGTQGTNWLLGQTNGKINAVGNILVTGVLGESASGNGFTKTGGGTLTLSGMNTYTGTTTVAAGTLLFTVPGAFYSGLTSSWTATSLVVEGGATAAFRVGGASDFTAGDIDLVKAMGTATGGFKAGSSLGLETNGAATTFTYSSVIADTNSGANSIGFVKLGTGTLTLTAANTYTGATSVSAGTLALTGSGSIAASNRIAVAAAAMLNVSGLTGGANFAAGSFALGSGQMLCGTGIVNATTVGFRAGLNTTIAPGTTISAGTLTIMGDAVFTGSTYDFELATAGTGSSSFLSPGFSSPALPHTNHDVLSVTGTANVNGELIRISTLTGSGFDPNLYYSWTILTSGGLSGTAAVSIAPGSDFAAASGTFTLMADGNNLVLNYAPISAPEPATALAIAAASLLVGYRWRRQRTDSRVGTA